MSCLGGNNHNAREIGLLRALIGRVKVGLGRSGAPERMVIAFIFSSTDGLAVSLNDQSTNHMLREPLLYSPNSSTSAQTPVHRISQTNAFSRYIRWLCKEGLARARVQSFARFGRPHCGGCHPAAAVARCWCCRRSARTSEPPISAMRCSTRKPCQTAKCGQHDVHSWVDVNIAGRTSRVLLVVWWWQVLPLAVMVALGPCAWSDLLRRPLVGRPRLAVAPPLPGRLPAAL